MAPYTTSELARAGVTAQSSVLLRQAIHDVRTWAWTDTVLVRFSLVFDAPSWVFLSRVPVSTDQHASTRVAFKAAERLPNGRYEAWFSGLPQATRYIFRINGGDPRPPAQQQPPGGVTALARASTHLRTAELAIHRLRVLQDGDDDWAGTDAGELTFFASVYDTHSRGLLTAQRDHGPRDLTSGSPPIQAPFGAAFVLNNAPASLTLVASAHEDDRSIFNPGAGVGTAAPPLLPDLDELRKGGPITTTTLRRTFALGEEPGTQVQPFLAVSPMWDVVFELAGSLTTRVVPTMTRAGLSPARIRPTQWQSTVRPFMRSAKVSTTAGQVELRLGADGELSLAPIGSGAEAEVRLGGPRATAAIACSVRGESAYVIAIDDTGLLNFTTLSTEGSQPWRASALRTRCEPSLVHAGGSLHLLSSDDAGRLLHAPLIDGHTSEAGWLKVGEARPDTLTAAALNERSFCCCAQRPDGSWWLTHFTRSTADAWEPRGEALELPFEARVIVHSAVPGVLCVVATDLDERCFARIAQGGRWEPSEAWQPLGTLDELLSPLGRPVWHEAWEADVEPAPMEPATLH